MARFCYQCGAPSDGKNFCSECGADLRIVVGPNASPEIADTLSPPPAVAVVAYRPSASWTTLAVLWWLFAAYPAAAQAMDNRGEPSIVSPLIAVLVVSAVIAGALRLLYVAATRRARAAVLRVALTSPWMWVIAGFVCVLELAGQVGQG